MRDQHGALARVEARLLYLLRDMLYDRRTCTPGTGSGQRRPPRDEERAEIRGLIAGLRVVRAALLTTPAPSPTR